MYRGAEAWSETWIAFNCCGNTTVIFHTSKLSNKNVHNMAVVSLSIYRSIFISFFFLLSSSTSYKLHCRTGKLCICVPFSFVLHLRGAYQNTFFKKRGSIRYQTCKKSPLKEHIFEHKTLPSSGLVKTPNHNWFTLQGTLLAFLGGGGGCYVSMFQRTLWNWQPMFSRTHKIGNIRVRSFPVRKQKKIINKMLSPVGIEPGTSFRSNTPVWVPAQLDSWT